MRRRDFIQLVVSSVIAWPCAVHAQQAGSVPRIGFLTSGSLESPAVRRVVDAFRQGLNERGYVEGQNIVIEYRGAGGNIERFPDLAAELVRLKVDLMLVPNTPAALAAQQATTTIPVVVPVMGDPIGDGLVASLARPGGNITGLTPLGPELVPKRVELLKEALPNMSRVVVLWHPGGNSERATKDMLRETETAARALRVQIRFVDVRGADEIDRAFSAITTEPAEALLVFPSPMLFLERRRIVDLAAKYRLPSIFTSREYVEQGGLISYGANVDDLFRRSAIFVDKILKGAKPGDLPVEQSTKFELVINLKTAKALGLTIPPSILARADEVIEQGRPLPQLALPGRGDQHRQSPVIENERTWRGRAPTAAYDPEQSSPEALDLRTCPWISAFRSGSAAAACGWRLRERLVRHTCAIVVRRQGK